MSNQYDLPWVIEIYTPDMTNAIRIPMTHELLIGRSLDDESKQPDIDLAPYGAKRHGVSARHLLISADAETLYVQDLGSEHGTMLNGDPISPGELYPIHQKSYLKLGDLTLEIRLIVTPAGELTSTVASTSLPQNNAYILVVEDDPEVAKVLTLALKRAGYEVVVAHEVLSAIRTYNRRRPDGVLLDLMLPDMNGLEFCRYIRRDVSTPGIPIIVASADVKSEGEALAAGADIFMAKPLRLSNMQETLADLLANRPPIAKKSETKRLNSDAAPPPLSHIGEHGEMAVVYVAGYGNEPLNIKVQNAVSFGRGGRSTALTQHVDLTEYGADERGVSRIHMFLHYENQQFFIEDNGSTNGTFLNNERLVPHQRVPLENGSDIRIGMLQMNIYMLSEG